MVRAVPVAVDGRGKVNGVKVDAALTLLRLFGATRSVRRYWVSQDRARREIGIRLMSTCKLGPRHKSRRMLERWHDRRRERDR